MTAEIQIESNEYMSLTAYVCKSEEIIMRKEEKARWRVGAVGSIAPKKKGSRRHVVPGPF